MTPPSRRRDAGGASAELVIATPLLLLLLAVVVQVGLWAHGQHSAEAIARQALAEARGAEGSATEGRTRAEEATAQLAGALLDDITIDVERDATQARVEIRASVPSLIPATTWPVQVEAVAPVERVDEFGGAEP
jgi:Flp pilus assembly protein TadG